MNKQDLSRLSDEELLIKKKELKKSKIWHAISIGFLAGVLIFGTVSWSLSDEKRLGFFIPMLIPIVFIYKMLQGSKKNRELEEVLRERGLI